MQLRDYQQQAVNSVINYFSQKSGNPLVVMPCGTGKSLTIAGLIKQACSQYPQTRILVATHVKELIKQNSSKMMMLWPHAHVGICSAGLNGKDTQHQIIFGGIATIANCVEAIGFRDLLLIDEAHLVPPSGKGTYLTVIKKLMAINPNLKVIGFTATDYRMGQGKLTDEGEIFTDVCCNMASPEWFIWFIANGYLVRPIPQKTRVSIDTSQVAITGGEFNATELQEASDRYEITLAAAKEAIQYGQMRRSWVTFCSGIEHAVHAAEIFTGLGVETHAVHSKLDKKDRDKLIAAWQNYEIRNLTNNGIMTCGLDHPGCDMIINLRATNSTGLWSQIVGRVMRPCPQTGKENGLVLDFARNTERLGTIDAPRIPRKKGAGSGEIPIKLCDECGAYNHISARVCDQCGNPFEIQVKIEHRSDTAELMSSSEPEIGYYDVGNIVYSKHVNYERKTETIRVDYHCDRKRFSEYLSFNEKQSADGAIEPSHPTAVRKSKEWWTSRFGDRLPTPPSVELALGSINYAKKPLRIRVWTNKPGKYPNEIMGFEF